MIWLRWLKARLGHEVSPIVTRYECYGIPKTRVQLKKNGPYVEWHSAMGFPQIEKQLIKEAIEELKRHKAP